LSCFSEVATSGAGNAYTSGASEFTPIFFNGVGVAQSLVFFVVFCTPLFVLFLLAIDIVLSIIL